LAGFLVVRGGVAIKIFVQTRSEYTVITLPTEKSLIDVVYKKFNFRHLVIAEQFLAQSMTPIGSFIYLNDF